MERAASLGELQRFAQKFGVDALVDENVAALCRAWACGTLATATSGG